MYIGNADVSVAMHLTRSVVCVQGHARMVGVMNMAALVMAIWQVGCSVSVKLNLDPSTLDANVRESPGLHSIDKHLLACLLDPRSHTQVVVSGGYVHL